MTLLIISGGQTGVDRAALDAALRRGLAVGGWCPAGRRAEDGRIPARYPLRETSSSDPAQRTRRNVRDADVTLVLTPDPPTGGTALTIEVARDLGRPHLIVDPHADGAEAAADWLRCQGREAVRLNVAGPRQSETPGIYEAATGWLGRLLDLIH